MHKHTNFEGYTVITDLGADNEGYWALQVKRVVFPEGEDWGCDFCAGPSVAEYEVDAVAVLGEGGYNVQYCQHHAAEAAMSVVPDEWVSPEERADAISRLKSAGTLNN